MSNYYIYIYLDPRKFKKYIYGEYEFEFEPFYIGKGKNNRIERIDGRSKDFINIINEIEEIGLKSIYFKLYENLNEEQSFELETKLIKEIGRLDLETGPLINRTSGGQGSSGYKHLKETIEKFSKKLRKNFFEIKNEFENRKYILLTEENEYKNARQKLNYICPRGHKGFIIWINFKRGNGCLDCFNEKQRKNFFEIKNEFENRKYILLTEENEYVNSKQKLKYICPNNHESSICWNAFRRGQGCPYCAENKINFFDINQEFERRGYKLLTEENEYKNAHQKLKYICPQGHEGSMKWSHFKQGHGCPIEGVESSSKKRRKNIRE